MKTRMPLARDHFDHCLIPYGEHATVLCRIELRGNLWLLVRPVSRNGLPRVKNARKIYASEMIAQFDGWPTTDAVRDARRRYHDFRKGSSA